MPELCLIDGRVRPMSSASIPIDDWAVRYGWGLFETIRIHKNCPLFLARHIKRLCGTAPLLELGADSEAEHNRWHREIARAVRQSSMREGIVNCYWTRGSLFSRIPPARIVRIRPRPRYPKRPINLWVTPWRIEPTYPGVGVKSLAYFPYIFAGMAARRSGFDEALVLNTKDRVADGAASSIFVVKKGRILTPNLDQGTLPGVTRSVVLEFARMLNMPVREAAISWRSLLEADEIFISSSLRGVVPVAKVSNQWKSKFVKKSVFSRVQSEYVRAIASDITHYRQAS